MKTFAEDAGPPRIARVSLIKSKYHKQNFHFKEPQAPNITKHLRLQFCLYYGWRWDLFLRVFSSVNVHNENVWYKNVYQMYYISRAIFVEIPVIKV